METIVNDFDEFEKYIGSIWVFDSQFLHDVPHTFIVVEYNTVLWNNGRITPVTSGKEEVPYLILEQWILNPKNAFRMMKDIV